MPFGEWIDLWYQTWSSPACGSRRSSALQDRIYNHIIPHVDKIPLNKLTQSDLQQFYAELKRNGRRIRRDLYYPACRIAWYAPVTPPAGSRWRRRRPRG
ncbi:MAG: hypothetical protein ACLUFI_02995 [Oscillospiraceae bacterium]